MSETATDAERAKQQLKYIMEQQLDEFFEDRNKKPWKTEEWEDKRDENLGGECKWCGDSDGTLVLHHTDYKFQNGRNWRRVYRREEDHAFQESDQFDPSLMEKKDGNSHRTPRDEYFVEKFDWMKDNMGVVMGRFRDRYNSHWEEYFDLSNEGVVTICNTCHFNYHENGMKPCDRCGESYGKPRHKEKVKEAFAEEQGIGSVDGRLYLCWECFAPLAGIEECDCGDGWYNPEYYDECKSCRN